MDDDQCVACPSDPSMNRQVFPNGGHCYCLTGYISNKIIS